MYNLIKPPLFVSLLNCKVKKMMVICRNSLLCGSGQEGAGWECPGAQWRWAGGHVGAGAQPAPARVDKGRHGPAEAAPAHAKEPRLCCQLPHQARLPERGAWTTKSRAATRSGQTGSWKRQHATGAGRASCQVRGPAVLRPDSHPRASW